MRNAGIYKITNLSNSKFYIGQSRDIFSRWKAHTISLHDTSNESVIRMAFAKNNLRDQVSKPGIYGNFNFEIVEICPEENLLERERHYIQELKPHYNVQLMGVNSIFPKRDSQNHNTLFNITALKKWDISQEIPMTNPQPLKI